MDEVLRKIFVRDFCNFLSLQKVMPALFVGSYWRFFAALRRLKNGKNEIGDVRNGACESLARRPTSADVARFRTISEREYFIWVPHFLCSPT